MQKRKEKKIKDSLRVLPIQVRWLYSPALQPKEQKEMFDTFILCIMIWKEKYFRNCVNQETWLQPDHNQGLRQKWLEWTPYKHVNYFYLTFSFTLTVKCRNVEQNSVLHPASFVAVKYPGVGKWSKTSESLCLTLVSRRWSLLAVSGPSWVLIWLISSLLVLTWNQTV